MYSPTCRRVGRVLTAEPLCTAAFDQLLLLIAERKAEDVRLDRHHDPQRVGKAQAEVRAGERRE